MPREVRFAPSAAKLSELFLQRVQQMTSKKVESIERQLTRCRSRLLVHLDDKGRHLVGFQLCRSRWCCYCDKGRSKKVAARLADRMFHDETGSQYLMLTINVGHTVGESMKVIFERLRDAYASFRNRNGWKHNVAGFLQKLDIGMSHESSSHPHYHVFVKLKAGVDKADAMEDLNLAFSEMLAEKNITGDLVISGLDTDNWLSNAVDYISNSWLTYNGVRGLGNALTQMPDDRLEEIMTFMHRRRVHDFGGVWRGEDSNAEAASRVERIEMPFIASCQKEIFIHVAHVATLEKSVENVQKVLYFMSNLRVCAEMYAHPSLVHTLMCMERALSNRFNELSKISAGIPNWTPTMRDPRSVHLQTPPMPPIKNDHQNRSV